MGLSETLFILLSAAVLMAVVLGLLLKTILRSKPGSAATDDNAATMMAEIEALRTANSDFRQKLAVEEFRASESGKTEAALTEAVSKAEIVKDEKAKVESELAVGREALEGMRNQERELRTRLAAAENRFAAAKDELNALQGAKAVGEEKLSARAVELAGADASIQDLKQRLNASQAERKAVEDDRDRLRTEKAAVDGILSARNEALKNGEAKTANLQAQADLLADELSALQKTAEAALAEAASKAETVRDEKAKVEADFAVGREALEGVRNQEKELRVRLAAAESKIAVIGGELDIVQGAKAVAEEKLSARTVELTGADASIQDLRHRLDAAQTERKAVEDDRDRLRTEKADVDGILSARNESLRNGEATTATLKAQMASLTGELSAMQKTVADLKAANAMLQEKLDQERKQADEKLALLAAARTEMTQEFKSLAEEVMSRHGQSFSKLNREQIDGILAPLKEKLGEFERTVQASQTENVKERATLAEQIRHIAETGAAMGKETRELTEALRGRFQTQGAWGEMVLAKVLEQSGLRPDEDYSVQKSLSNEDGHRLRPDVVVNLPDNKRLVVDSKVSLTAFDRLVNAASEKERSEHLQKHLASIRSHISLLSSKEYHQTTGTTLDYVVMFVPIEGALAAALKAEPSLISFATEKNVAITTPTTLVVALRTVANVLQVERRNQNAEQIAIRAGKMYDKFVGFVTDLIALGDSIAKTRQHFEGAMSKLSTGQGNAIGQMQSLKNMGARTSKSLPPSLLEAAEGNIVVALRTSVTEAAVTVETKS